MTERDFNQLLARIEDQERRLSELSAEVAFLSSGVAIHDGSPAEWEYRRAIEALVVRRDDRPLAAYLARGGKVPGMDTGHAPGQRAAESP
jgi:hypothetical protein